MIRALGVPIVALALIAGCSARPIGADDAGAIGGGGGTIGLGGAGGGATFTPTNKVDMLFVIDDSAGTSLLHANLLRNFPTFISSLRSAPTPPDLRIAVVSTDLGAGDGSVGGCDANGGKNGAFQYEPRGTCTASGLADGATFIADSGEVRNFAGSLEDVFTCIAGVGTSGCGFEHQLAATVRALGADGQPPPAENQGFLRPEAFLVVIILTDEDDCSAPRGSPLLDGPDALDGPLGFISSYRCNEFGHLCNGAKPPRRPPSGDAAETVTLEGCVSAEDAGLLTPVGQLVAQLRSVKPFPDQQIVVAAIAGPATPYTVHWQLRPNETTPRAHVTASCTGPDSGSAAPAVRVSQFARAFGDNGLLLPACSDNYAPGLQRIGERLRP